MEEFDPPLNVEVEKSPLKLEVNPERILDNDFIYVGASTVTRVDGSKLSLIPIISGTDSGEQAPSKALALTKEGIKLDILPAYDDRFTPEEASFAKDKLGYSNTRTKHPFMVQLHEKNPDKRDILFFEPTPKAILDVMLLAGHDSKQLRDARLAALRGEPHPVTDVIKLISQLGQINERAHPRQEKNEQLPSVEEEALITVFRAKNLDLRSSIDELCSQGLDAHIYKRLKRQLDEGVDRAAIQEIASGDDDVTALVKDAWEETIEYSKRHNHDPSGVYTEIHKVGKQYILLPALTSTAWEVTSDLGFVFEGSGHNLAQIYQESFRDPQHNNSLVDNAARNNRLIGLAQRLGLDTETLIARGRWANWDQHGEGLVINSLRWRSDSIPAIEHGSFPDIVKGVEKLGVKILTSADEKVKEVETAKNSALKTSVDVRHISADGFSIPEYQKSENVTSGIIIGMDWKLVRWQEDANGKLTPDVELNIKAAEASVKSHTPLYHRLGINDPRGYLTVRMNGRQMRIGVRYSINEDNKSNNINIFFNTDYGKDGETAEQDMVRAISKMLASKNDFSKTVSVAKGNQKATIYEVE